MAIEIEQDRFIQTVRRMWAEGARQQDIAEALGKSVSTVRNRLAYTYGLKFGRAGKLIAIRGGEAVGSE